MPITADELIFFAAETMTDADSGGGPRSTNQVQDGVENNIFPDVAEADRLTGITRLRKVYPSVVSADDDPLLSATVCVDERPSDAAVEVSLFGYGDDTTTRAQVETNGVPTSAIAQMGTASGFPFTQGVGSYGPGSGITNIEITSPSGAGVVYDATALSVGKFIRVRSAVGDSLHQIQAVNPGAAAKDLDIQPALPDAAGAETFSVEAIDIPSTPRAYGTSPLAAQSAAASSTLTLEDFTVGLVPVGAAYPANDLGLAPGSRSASKGRFPFVFAGDIGTLWNEASVAPQVVANGNVINVGRPNLQQLIVVGNNGIEIARFLANGPVPAGVGCTANLAAGTVTFNDVTGYSQPVTVKHRIAERVAVLSAVGRTITLTAPLARTFAIGSVFSTELPRGDFVAQAANRFSQQAWTRAWSDSVIGSAVSPLYAGDLPVTSIGAETDRWAVEFTTLTQFRVHSERRGVIGTGNIATDYAPLNPATGEPFFTLLSGGWSVGGIAVGNVFRFNTTGAYRSAWALQCVHPSVAAGSTRTVLRLRGDVNA